MTRHGAARTTITATLASMAVAGALMFAVMGVGTRAHEIPADVVIQSFVKPDGRRLTMLVRAPLAAMRDVVFPTRDPGFLLLEEATPALRTAAALWIAGGVGFYENGEPTGPAELGAVRVSLPSDTSFAEWDTALAHVTGAPLAPETSLLWNQALLDVQLEFPIASDQSEFAIESDLARLGIRSATSLLFITPDGTERAFHFAGDPGLIRLDPRWHQAAWRFIKDGFSHILGGIDHLLFLVCLVAPFRRFRQLALLVTGFTVAHSITLISAALGFVPDALWFPPLVEALIAASIVYMAVENIVFEASAGDGAADGPGASAVRRRWILTCAFGLVHGFGFSFALSDTLQFAGSHLATSLVSFNIGVELGQLLVLVVLVPALSFAFRRLVAERIGVILLSALVLHTAWHWMLERGQALGGYAWSFNDTLWLADVLRWTMRAVVVMGVVWLVRSVIRSRAAGAGQTNGPMRDSK
jgi:hypothetical protein